jgi:hypothetical protein
MSAVSNKDLTYDDFVEDLVSSPVPSQVVGEKLSVLHLESHSSVSVGTDAR